MTLSIAIHQPNYAPWLGYFAKMAACDVFVLLDDVQFSKSSYTNRVRIQDDRWLTVPVRQHLGQTIRDVQVSHPGFAEKHSSMLRAFYGDCEPVDDYCSLLADHHSASLLELNLSVLSWVRNRLEIDVPMVLSSTLEVNSRSTQRLVDIVKHLAGDAYIRGAGAVDYQDDDLFHRAGVTALELNYVEPDYPRGTLGAARGLSALDAIFLCGAQARSLVVSR